MAAKTGWHRYGTKLRHYHPIYIQTDDLLLQSYRCHCCSSALRSARAHFYSAPDKGAEYCDACVCLSASEHISQNCVSHFRQLFMHVTYVRGSILLWRRCDILCTSGFTDDVLLVHNGYAGCRNMRRNCDSTGCSMDLSPWRMLTLTHRAANRRQSLGPNLLNILRFIVRLS